MAATGQCLCGEVKYELHAAPSVTAVCHCKNCQRTAGSAFSTLAGMPTSEFEIVSGEPKRYLDQDTASGNPVERYFCGTCGSPIYSAIPGMPGMAFVKTGSLDDTSSFVPQFHAWCDSKQDWVTIEEGTRTMPRGT